MTGRLILALVAVSLLLGALVGGAAAWWWLDPVPVPAVAIVAAPQRTQSDGSTVAARKPEAAPKPMQEVPAGAHVAGVGRVEIKPKPGRVDSLAASPGATCICDPVALDLTLVETEAGPDLVVSGQGGEITAAEYRPSLGLRLAPHYVHGLGVTWRPAAGGDAERWGVIYQRDWRRFRAGVALEHAREMGLQGQLQGLLLFK